jgi:hypothetical protein
MASTFVVSRTHLIYGVCIPLAILVGYFLALPLESGGLAVIVLLFSVLSIPILMRWHHPLLIFSCNAAFMMPEFIPGRPNLWMVMAVLSLFFSVVNRSLESGVNFFRARSVSRSLIFFAIVVLVTAYFTGGITFRSLGASSYGGKKYFSIATAIILYFALSTPAVPPKRTGLAVGLFFISTFTWLAGYIAVAGGPAFYFLSDFLPIEGVVNAAYSMESVIPSGGMARLGSGLYHGPIRPGRLAGPLETLAPGVAGADAGGGFGFRVSFQPDHDGAWHGRHVLPRESPPYQIPAGVWFDGRPFRKPTRALCPGAAARDAALFEHFPPGY